jgi:hypothetical protein
MVRMMLSNRRPKQISFDPFDTGSLLTKVYNLAPEVGSLCCIPTVSQFSGRYPSTR